MSTPYAELTQPGPYSTGRDVLREQRRHERARRQASPLERPLRWQRWGDWCVPDDADYWEAQCYAAQAAARGDTVEARYWVEVFLDSTDTPVQVVTFDEVPPGDVVVWGVA